MPKNGLNVSLNSYDDIFSTEETRQEEQREQVQQIPIDELYPFKDHPFKVLDDEAMQRTVESIKQLGVTNPLIARPRPDGGYEIISGHRRQHAAQLARLKTLPVIVRDMSDDAAVLLMVDSNLQREQILPSERAFAYKMKLDALKRQGARSDLTSSQVGMKLQALDIVGQEAGDSRNQVHRFIRLTNLIPELLDMVDEKKISFNPAVELSYLDESQQRDFLEAMQRIEVVVRITKDHCPPQEQTIFEWFDLMRNPTDALSRPNLEINLEHHRVFKHGTEVYMSRYEYGVLSLMAQHPGKLFTKEQIFEAVWHKDSESYLRAVTSTISRIRQKIEDDKDHPRYIKTVSNIGIGAVESQSVIKAIP